MTHLNTDTARLSRPARVGTEARSLLRLAMPIIIAQLATTAMGFVDAVMAGRVSPRDLASVALGNSIWIPVYLLMSGVLLATTPKVAQRFGAAQFDEIGPFDTQFFIDYVDIEWCSRARAKGFELHGVPASHMEHSVGEGVLRVLGRRLPVHAPQRQYYLVRNARLFARKRQVPMRGREPRGPAATGAAAAGDGAAHGGDRLKGGEGGGFERHRALRAGRPQRDQAGHEWRAGDGKPAEKMRDPLNAAALGARKPHLHTAARDRKGGCWR